MEGPVHYFSHLFDTSDFPARWNCGNWSADLGWLHILSDGAIAAVYFAIPLALLVFLAKRPTVPFPFLLCLFAAFILLCGSGHLMEAVMFWWPAYRFTGLIKLLTALVSLATLIALLPILPKALALPDVVALNQQLADEIGRRKILASIIDCSSDAIFSKESEGVISSWNRGAERLYGYTAEEAIGQTVTLIVPEDRRSEVHELLGQIAQGTSIENFETIRVCKDGTLRDISLSLFPLYDAQDQIFGAASIGRDISAQKQLERALQSSKKRFDSLLQANIVGIMTSSLDGKVGQANNEMLRILGFSRQELENQAICWHDLVTPESRGSIHADAWKTTSMTQQHRAWEAEFERPDGSRVPAMIGVTNLDAEEGLYLCFVLDITNQRAARQAMKEAKELAEKANQAKSDFLATITHELRTPLSGVIAMTELLADTELDEDQQKFVNCCCSSGNALLALINNVLDVSKIEKGRLELSYHAFDLSAMLEDVVQTMHARAANQAITLTCRWDSTQKLIVEGDSHRLCQVLLNLIGNAIKFTPAGEVTLTVEAKRQMERQIELSFSVEDTGIGISADCLDKLFQPFMQADSSTSRRFGGTGLGLSICQQLVQAMGGNIQVESQPEVGSRFYFTLVLPVIESPSPSEQTRTPRLNKEKPTPPTTDLPAPQQTKTCHVLVAEDNATNQLFIREILTRGGWHCTIAFNGIEALERATSERFDLVLMDCQMPEMDGFEATQKIRQWEQASQQSVRLPIIGLTANAFRGDRQRCLDAGMDDYLSKPYTRVQFWEVLSRHIDSQAPSAVETAPNAMEEQAAPAIDIDSLLDQCLDDVNFMSSLLETFTRDGQTHIQQLEHHLQVEDAKGVADRAHQIAGMASIVGAKHLHKLSCHMEELGAIAELSTAKDAIKPLKSEFEQCIRISNRWRNSVTGTT